MKTQKEKDIAARTTVLLKPSHIAALEDDLIEQIQEELRVTETDDASNMQPSETPPPTNDNVQEPPQPDEQPQTSTFKLINQVLRANREHDSLQKYRDLAGWNG